MLTEDKLIKACIKQDRIAQKELFDRYSGQMLIVCLRFARDEPEAKDMLMEGMLQVFNHIADFRKECPLEAWIRKIMVNTALKQYRKRNKIYPVVDAADAEHLMQGEEMSVSDGFEDILPLIASLPERHRVVLNLYVFEEMSHQEIANLLGIPVGTSKSDLSRARAKLQELLKKRNSIAIER